MDAPNFTSMSSPWAIAAYPVGSSSMRGCGNRGAAGSYLKQNYEMLAERPRGLLSGEVYDPVWPGITRLEHRYHLRQFEPGQRAGRARAQDLAGPESSIR
jgi:hypothetical protein